MADPGGLDLFTAYLRRVCPDCLNTLAHLSTVDADILYSFVWEDQPLSLDAVGRVSLAVLQMNRDPGSQETQ